MDFNLAAIYWSILHWYRLRLRVPRCAPLVRRGAAAIAPWLILVGGTMHGATLYAEDAQAFLIFPQVTGVYRSKTVEPLDQTRNEFDIGASVFISRDFDTWRLLGEAFVSDDEQEVERAQLGWMFAPGSIAWLGRFHNPLGFWNTQYHHGSYLQTSITRPGIFEYEDKDGPLPSHLTGLLLEGMFTQGAAEWHYVLAAGAGPDLGDRLEPLNVLRPTQGIHKLGTTLRLSYQPDSDERDEFGVYMAYNQIAGVASMPVYVRQRVVGGFVNWQWSETRVRSEVVFANDEFDTPVAVRGSFVNAYLQVEQPWRADWTAYGRVEGTRGGNDDAYLAHFAGFVKARNLVGLRYELTPHQALKLEISRVYLQDIAYNQWALQWASFFP
jgi:hypothetical protein